jgi:hypothetical protein
MTLAQAFATPLMTAAIAAGLSFTFPAPAPAQWLDRKAPGIPRLPDGKPNLAAPAPRLPDGKPDLSGLWDAGAGGSAPARGDPASAAATSKGMDSLKAQPWAKAFSDRTKENFGSDSPSVHCLPPGPKIDLSVGKIVQTPNLLLMLFDGTLYRQIFLDGRRLQEDPNPDWMGYSAGHWEGDTLVVESNGFNDRTWLDDDGHPHTQALHMTERLRRPDFGHLELVRTLTDPGALAQPWTVPQRFELSPDTEGIEYVCNENEKDRLHLVGKASDIKGLEVDPKVLTKYAGSYELTIPDNGKLLTVTFTVDRDHLVMGCFGASVPLTALSDVEFAAEGGNVKFVIDEAGAVPYAILQAVEGDIKAYRK